MSPCRLLPILHVVYILSVLPFGEVKCGEYDPISDATWRDMNGNIIQVPEYCESKHKNCLIKCCPEDHYIEVEQEPNTCVEAKDDEVKKRLKISDIYVYKRDDNLTLIKTDENITTAFIFVQNEHLSDLSNSIPLELETVVLDVSIFYIDTYLLNLGI